MPAIADVARSRGATAVIGLRVRREDRAAVREWQRKIGSVMVQQDGFQAFEVLPPIDGVQDEHVVVVSFITLPHLQAWLGSPLRAELLKEIGELCVEPPTHQVFAGRDRATPPATGVITVTVAEGFTQEYLAWQRDMDAMVSTTEGFSSTELFPPASDDGGDWTVVIHFDSSDHMHAWLESPERRQHLDRARAFAKIRWRSVVFGFGSWFEGSARAGDFIVLPPRWKQGLTVLAPLFPTVTLITMLLLPHLGALPVPLRVLVGNILAVGVLTWFGMPLANRVLGPWLRGSLPPRESYLTLAGVLLAIAATATALTALAALL